LVNCWGTFCSPCMIEFPELVTINRMYRHRDFELVTLSANLPEETAEVLAFLQKQQASNKNYIFATSDREKLMEAFDTDWPGAVPYTLLPDPAGKVLYRELGSIDALAIKRAIVKALNAQKPW